MTLHSDKELFKDTLEVINKDANIYFDILEKDYYVCMILRYISEHQEELQAYFKGGTAVYKILEMHRFSEDIDLTVKVDENITDSQKSKKLKASALKYNLDGLTLLKEQSIVDIGSITGIYKYNSVFNIGNNPLHKAGKIQIESTSFTISEPTKDYTIEPLIYTLANDSQKLLLKEKFDVKPFNIKIVSLERMFIDKIFAIEYYFIRKRYMDTAKHLYDITILLENEVIKNLFKNDLELNNIIKCSRDEQKVRKGGIDERIKITDFSYFKLNFDKELLDTFNTMQFKYILNDKYKISIETVENALKIVYNIFKDKNL